MEHEIAQRRVIMKSKVTDLRGNIKSTFQVTGRWERRVKVQRKDLGVWSGQ